MLKRATAKLGLFNMVFEVWFINTVTADMRSIKQKDTTQTTKTTQPHTYAGSHCSCSQSAYTAASATNCTQPTPNYKLLYKKLKKKKGEKGNHSCKQGSVSTHYPAENHQHLPPYFTKPLIGISDFTQVTLRPILLIVYLQSRKLLQTLKKICQQKSARGTKKYSDMILTIKLKKNSWFDIS